MCWNSKSRWNMIRGLCGLLNKHSACMKDGLCKKYYPAMLLQEIQRGEDGYPKYIEDH